MTLTNSSNHNFHKYLIPNSIRVNASHSVGSYSVRYYMIIGPSRPTSGVFSKLTFRFCFFADMQISVPWAHHCPPTVNLHVHFASRSTSRVKLTGKYIASHGPSSKDAAQWKLHSLTFVWHCVMNCFQCFVVPICPCCALGHVFNDLAWIINCFWDLWKEDLWINLKFLYSCPHTVGSLVQHLQVADFVPIRKSKIEHHHHHHSPPAPAHHYQQEQQRTLNWYDHIVLEGT